MRLGAGRWSRWILETDFCRFRVLGAMADGPCAPFSDPIGLSLGDGAGFVILESAERAAARGAKMHAELYGYGLSWDAYHITAPEPAGEGMNRAISMALQASGVQPDSVHYINVHGTGTRSNDAAETVGLKRFFDGANATVGADASRVPPISATKSFTGHMLGASSVLGVITSIVGMQNDWLPPTANLQKCDRAANWIVYRTCPDQPRSTTSWLNLRPSLEPMQSS